MGCVGVSPGYPDFLPVLEVVNVHFFLRTSVLAYFSFLADMGLLCRIRVRLGGSPDVLAIPGRTAFRAVFLLPPL